MPVASEPVMSDERSPDLPHRGFSNVDSSHSSFSYVAPRVSASALAVATFSKALYRSWPGIHSYLHITSVQNPSMLPVSPWPWIELNFTSKIS